MVSKADELARLLKILSVGTRVRIVQLLKERALCVNALADRLGITGGAVSQHLRVMRDAGLVSDERCGYYVHYRLDAKALAAWRKAIGRLMDPMSKTPADRKGTRTCATTKKTNAARSRKT